MILDRQICRNSVILMAVFSDQFEKPIRPEFSQASLYKSLPASFTIKVSGSSRKLS